VLSGAEDRQIALAPDLGADNEAVFGELGLRAEDLERLRGKGVL
jgi:crotonobetainyl-CoA:carnitine CoA-transferase CaiB-like acyl-CoA transferase